MNYNTDELYNAVSEAETGSFVRQGKDPFMRTVAQGSGSSAYGPVQMTGGQNSMMMNVFNDSQLSGRLGITEEEREYMSKFLQQADKFLEPVSDEENSTYGYGGSGELNEGNNRNLYESVAKKFMKYEYDRAGQNMDKFIENWRGAPEYDGYSDEDKGRTIDPDEDYYERVRGALPVASIEDKAFDAMLNSSSKTPALDIISQELNNTTI